MPSRILVVGASSRMAAQLANQLGYQVTAADLFGDWDTQQVAEVWRLERLSDVTKQVKGQKFEAVILTGGMENRPELVTELGSMFDVRSPPANMLAESNKWSTVAAVLSKNGIRIPQSSPIGKPGWIRKQNGSCGGLGVERAGTGDPQETAAGWYYQEPLPGKSVSCVYLGNGEEAKLLGATQQWVGRSELGCREFAYCGSLGPIGLSSSDEATALATGNCLSQRFNAIGLFGVDFISHQSSLIPVDFNPRIPASLEVVSRLNRQNHLAHHLDPASWQPAPAHADECFGKAIVFNRSNETIVVSEPIFDWTTQHWDPELSANGISTADIPCRNTKIQPGHPILTIIAKEKSPAKVHERLIEFSKLVYDQFQPQRPNVQTKTP